MSPRSHPQRISIRRRLLFAAIALLVAVVGLEGVTSVGWLARDFFEESERKRITQRKAQTTILQDENLEAYHSRYDEELGWVHIEGRRIDDFYGPQKHMTINSWGLRGVREISGKRAEDYRVVCLGDSVTMGYGVDDSETYPAQLGGLNAEIETINMGMGGYSTCQCGLWYQRLHDRLDADLVVFSIIADDVARSGKQPSRFAVDEGQVVVTNIPVPRYFAPSPIEEQAFRWSRFLVQHSSLARSFAVLKPGPKKSATATRASPEELTSATIRQLHARTQEAGAELVLVLMPNSSQVPGHIDFNLEQQRTFLVVARLLEQSAAELDLPFLNLLPAFAEYEGEPLAGLFLPEIYAHYSLAGNRLVADEMDRWLGNVVEGYPK